VTVAIVSGSDSGDSDSGNSDSDSDSLSGLLTRNFMGFRVETCIEMECVGWTRMLRMDWNGLDSIWISTVFKN
jgi:hypothetical protein